MFLGHLGQLRRVITGYSLSARLVGRPRLEEGWKRDDWVSRYLKRKKLSFRRRPRAGKLPRACENIVSEEKRPGGCIVSEDETRMKRLQGLEKRLLR